MWLKNRAMEKFKYRMQAKLLNWVEEILRISYNNKIHHKNLRIKINTIVFMVLLFTPDFISCQTPPSLGLAYRFVVFAAPGALNSTGLSPMSNGDVGTSGGDIIGFYNVVGQKHRPSDLTTQCALDIAAAYSNLNAQTPLVSHPVALGGGEVLTPNIYFLDGASTLTDTLTLDGEGDSNACFIIKINGAFGPAIGSVVNLIGQTQACNVFWSIIGGATFGANVNFKGNIIMAGAAVIGKGCNIEGRVLTLNGAVNADELTANIPSTLSSLPSVTRIPFEPVMGTTRCWALLTEEGAVTDAGLSNSVIVGHIGTNVGAVNGFDPLLVTGSIHSSPDDSTAQASTDLNILFSYLSTMPYDIELLNPLQLGNSQVFTPNVYFSKTAATLTDTIFLDGQGDSDARFLIRIGGALITGSSPQVVLLGGTQAKNVFWLTEGGVTVSAGDGTIIGEIVAHNGAITLHSGVTLHGRGLSSFGGITTYDVDVVSELCALFLLPIELLSFTAKVKYGYVQFNWVTATENNNDYFNIERSVDGINFTSIDKIKGAGNSTQVSNYSTIDYIPLNGISYYRLKQTDYDGKISYSKIEAVNVKIRDNFVFNIYPNPFSSETVLHTNENLKKASVVVYNFCGQIVHKIKNISGNTIALDCKKISNGLYFIHLIQDSKIIATDKLIITD